MLTPHEVDIEFFKLFWGQSLLPSTAIPITTHKGGSVNVRLQDGRVSSVNLSEAPREQYPVISIIPVLPKVRKDLLRSDQLYLADHRDTNSDGLLDKVTAYEYPIPFDFVYKVHTATLKESEDDALRLYFWNRFGFSRQKSFLFNKLSVPLIDDSLGGYTDIGEPIYYELESEEIPRSDGIKETLHTFKLLVWVDIKNAVDYDLISVLNIRNTNEDGTTQMGSIDQLHIQ